MLRKVLVTGGAGYVGCVLVPRLLAAGYEVWVFDVGYFGLEGLPDLGEGFMLVQGDIRNIQALQAAMQGMDAVIHLACISNDPSYELDEAFARSINYDAFKPMLDAAKDAGVQRFIYASSSAVYGVSTVARAMTETDRTEPITPYAQSKLACEKLLLTYQDAGLDIVILRPATLCGYSPRMRFDTMINGMTASAIARNEIVVHGGGQWRAHLEVEAMAEVYRRVLAAPSANVAGEIFNVGRLNEPALPTASYVHALVSNEFPWRSPVQIRSERDTIDPRSYSIDPTKMRNRLGILPVGSGMEIAIRGTCAAWRFGRFPGGLDDERYHNVKRMKALGAT